MDAGLSPVKRPLFAVLALMLGFVLACMPPTTYGLRSAGDLMEPGGVEAGAAVGTSLSGFTMVALDGGYTLNDRVGVGASLGLFGGPVQGQLDLRISSDRDDTLGFSGVFGVGGVTGLISAWGPYAGGSVRFGEPSRGFFYAGGKVNSVFNLGFTQVYLSPTAGYSTAGRPLRFGAEAVYFLPLSIDSFYAGIGAQVFATYRFKR